MCSVHNSSVCVPVVYGFVYVDMMRGWSVHRFTYKVYDVVYLLCDGIVFV